MNDAVESFLLFHNVRLTGTYDPAYEGELDALLTQDDNERYALIVHQGDSVVTLLFEDLTLENHYYDYSQLGHFWMKGYEYLRQLEYRIAILRDKLDYLGENSCNANERELASLAEFPPARFQFNRVGVNIRPVHGPGFLLIPALPAAARLRLSPLCRFLTTSASISAPVGSVLPAFRK